MESTTKIAKKFFDDYAWTQIPSLDPNVYEELLLSAFAWRHQTIIAKEGIPTGMSKIEFASKKAFEAFKNDLFPDENAVVMTYEDLYMLLAECENEICKNNSAVDVLKVVKDFVHKAATV